MRVSLRVAVILIILVETLVDHEIRVEALEAMEQFAGDQEEQARHTGDRGDQINDRDDLDLRLKDCVRI